MLNPNFLKPCFRRVMSAAALIVFGCLLGASWDFLSAQSQINKQKSNEPGISKPKPTVKSGSVLQSNEPGVSKPKPAVKPGSIQQSKVPGFSKPKQTVKPGLVPHQGISPKITRLGRENNSTIKYRGPFGNPVDTGIPTPDFSFLVHMGEEFIISGNYFSVDCSENLVVISPASDINLSEPTTCYTECDFAKGIHPFAATETELKVTAPTTLPSNEYCIWVFTARGGWSNPVIAILQPN